MNTRNLKLGYGGTKTEMERLLADAEKFSGVKYDINNLNDVYEAIHVIQEEMGVTGTTAQEAEKTISGSVASMKAAFDNFLNGSGSPEALAESLTNVFSNIGGAILQLAPSILTGVVQLIQTLVPQITQLLFNLVPQLLSTIQNMLTAISNMIVGNNQLPQTIGALINQIVSFITKSLPIIIQAGMWILIALIEGIADAMPDLIPMIIECIETITITIVENLPYLIQAGIKLIIALIQGLVNALPQLIRMLPTIIQTIVETLTKPEMIVKLIGAALKIMLALAEGLIKAMPQIISAVPKIITAIVKGFSNNIKNTNWGELGKNIIKGICDGFGKIGSYISRKVNEVKDQVVSKFKSIFGIHSPSTLMRDTIGLNITAGIGEGIEEGIPKALKDVDFAMKQLNAGIEASVNPTINPSVTYETSYNMMAQAMKEALSDMDVVMDDNKMGRFVVKTVTDTIYS